MEGNDQVEMVGQQDLGFCRKRDQTTDPKELEIWEDFDVKARLIILDGVRDALIPHLSGKNIAHEMWVSLQNLFQNKNEN